MIFYCDDQRHLVCVPYSVENLHLMAQQLGIKRCWFHGGKHPHYDIPKRRVVEVMSVCTMVSSRVILSIVKGDLNDERVPRDGGEVGTDDVPPQR